MQTIERVIWPLVFGAAFACGMVFEKVTGGFHVFELSLTDCRARVDTWNTWLKGAQERGGIGPIVGKK